MEITLESTRQFNRRHLIEELYTFNLSFSKDEEQGLITELKKEFDIKEEHGDYVHYTPAKIRICKNS